MLAPAQGTLGRVYGGDCGYVHIDDGARKHVGALVAQFLDQTMRGMAINSGKTITDDNYHMLPLCPGCTMIALFNAALILAERNGQSTTELANTMANAFQALAANPSAGLTEEVEIILDND
jgi:hypothetical protein